VKLLRIWLLVLLAILLPLRGAIAAAVPCADIGHHAPAAAPTTHHHMHATAVAAEAAASTGHGTHHHDHAGIDKCNLCSSCCSTAPLLLTFSPTVPALDGPAADFPLVQAPAPTFLSDGQERPPRSI
jgi:hypothetical protein